MAASDRAALVEALFIQQERVVERNNTVTWRKLKLQLPDSPLRHHWVKARVRVHQYPDGTLACSTGPPALPAKMPAAASRPAPRPLAGRGRARRRHEVAGQSPDSGCRLAPATRAGTCAPPRPAGLSSCHNGPSTASGSVTWSSTRSGQLICC